jgi:SAM-dependent methyltransferase
MREALTAGIRKVTDEVSQFGQRRGLDWLTYNPLLVRRWHRMEASEAPGVAEALASTFPNARRYVDIGAGTGTFAAALNRRGLDVVACEYTSTGRLIGKLQGVDCRSLDLRKDPPARLPNDRDLAYCFEVAEHVQPSLGDRLVRFVARQAPVVVFSAAQPGQAGTGHINLQPKTYWISRFKQAGMIPSDHLSNRLAKGLAEGGPSLPWLGENVMVYERPGVAES